MIVIEIRGYESLQRPFVQDEDVVEKRSAEATDHAFHLCVLPGRGRCRDDFIDTETLEFSPDPVSINAVAIS